MRRDHPPAGVRILEAVLLAALLLLGGAARADPIERWAAHVDEASARFKIPVQWVRRVMDIESGGRALIDGRPVVSRAGAMGLMQLMPGTWRDMRALLGLGPDPFDPHDNILAGAAYLRLMYNRFGYPGFFAAYNAGPRRYADYLLRGRPLPAETIAYVGNLVLARSGIGSVQRPVRAANSPALVISSPSSWNGTGEGAASAGLFAIRK